MATMTADETLRFLEARTRGVSHLGFGGETDWGVEIYDSKQKRFRVVSGPTIRAAAEKAEEILEVSDGDQKNNETETA